MNFAFGEKVYRDRRGQKTDPYNPGETVAGEWDPDLTIELPGAFVASSSSSAVVNETRSQILTSKSLFLTNTAADVMPGDRIRVGSTPFTPPWGLTPPYQVQVRPSADTNPFTGWQPAVEIPLELTEG